MKTKLIVAFLCLCGGNAFADGEWSCFSNGALKDNFILRFQTEAEKVTGTFTIERGYGADGTEEHEFSGTKAGDVLSVKFDKTLPEEDGAKISRMEMTIRQAGDEQALKAKSFGADKKLLSTADYEACEPGFTRLSQDAERISFPKSAMTIDRSIDLERKNQRFAFPEAAEGAKPLRACAGRRHFIFRSREERYDEGTAIDDLNIENAKAGDYLLVFSPAPEPQRCSVTFTLSDGAGGQ